MPEHVKNNTVFVPRIAVMEQAWKETKTNNILLQHMSSMEQAARILVSGIVQGVAFRYIVRAAAGQYHLRGYVKNLDDGTVEIKCEGRRENIDNLVKSIRGCGEPVRVGNVDVQYAEGTGQFKLFRVVTGDIAEEIAEGFSTGAMYMARADAKQDKMLGGQEKMLAKQDVMIDKQDQTITEIRALASDLRDMMYSKMQKMEKDISEIKAHLQI